MEQLLAMSVTGGILILTLLVLRRFCGKYLPRKCFIWISMVLMLRLLLPVQVPILPEQIPTVKGMLEQIRMSTPNGKQRAHSTDILSSEDADNSSDAGKDSVLSSNNASYDAAFSKKGGWNRTGLFLLWLCGVVLTAVFFLHRMWREYRVYRQALPASTREFAWRNRTVQVPIFHSDQILSYHRSLLVFCVSVSSCRSLCLPERKKVRNISCFMNACISVTGII